MRKEHKNVSMLYIANWFIFIFIVIFALSMFQSSSTAGVIMLICAAFCSPFVSKKLLESGKFSKSLIFILDASLFLIMWVWSVAVGTPKVEPAKEPQQIIAEEPTTEATEQATEPPTETEPETVPETTETATEAATEPETTIPETEAPTEPPTEAKKQVGKNVDELGLIYFGDVRNDVTGNWKYSMFSGAGVNFSEYAVSYYDEYMSQGEIHAVINTANSTTIKVSDSSLFPDEIYLTVYSYVDGEEHDAVLMFSGTPLKYYTVNKGTGEITEE